MTVLPAALRCCFFDLIDQGATDSPRGDSRYPLSSVKRDTPRGFGGEGAVGFEAQSHAPPTPSSNSANTLVISDGAVFDLAWQFFAGQGGFLCPVSARVVRENDSFSQRAVGVVD